MEEKSLESIIDTIFTQPPKSPCTYNIALAEQVITQTTIFQLLMSILINGARKLYGENITPNDISHEQFEQLKKYIESIGYQIKYNYKFLTDQNVDQNVDQNKPKIMNIWFEPIQVKFDCHGRKIF